MKKLALLFVIFFTTLSIQATNKNTNRSDEDSYKCRLQAYNYANSQGYEYGSEEWQWAYVSTKQLCEEGQL
jgi:hypothetical protein